MSKNDGIQIKTLTGPALQPLLPALARLRIQVFRDWPYLYDGDDAYETAYLRRYAQSPGAAIVVAFDGSEPVGASTCLPMAHETDDITRPFRDRGMDISSICYFGESVLLPAWRGRGIGVAFFAAREAHARQLGAKTTAFCAVQRDAADPRRPADAQDLQQFWTNRGYRCHFDIYCVMNWREYTNTAEIAHKLLFWIKNL